MDGMESQTTPGDRSRSLQGSFERQRLFCRLPSNRRLVGSSLLLFRYNKLCQKPSR